MHSSGISRAVVSLLDIVFKPRGQCPFGRVRFHIVEFTDDSQKNNHTHHNGLIRDHCPANFVKHSGWMQIVHCFIMDLNNRTKICLLKIKHDMVIKLQVVLKNKLYMLTYC
jgi:hypothetical protein